MSIETKRLYFDNPYQTEFEAEVLGRMEYQGKPAVILDQTVFYPEGGGQPSDKGKLSDVAVQHVLEQDGKILHIVDQPVAGKTVTGKIDWDRRFDHMQQHAGQHVLSQCFDKLLSGRTMSFHLGEHISTLEIAVSALTDADVDRVEACANLAVFQNREIKTYFVDEAGLSQVPLRKPPQKQGRIRVVEVAGFDFSACGGTHPGRTGEIGLIKLLKRDKIRNNTRFEFVCGRRALWDYRSKHRILTDVSVKFSSGESDLPKAVDKFLLEHKDNLRALKKLRGQALQQEAQEIAREMQEPAALVKIFQDRPVQDVRQLALSLIQAPGRVVFLGVQSGSHAHVIMGRCDALSLDMRDLIPVVSPLLNARGGGRPSLVEMAGDKPEALQAALDEAKNRISQN